jgi:VHL beta domain
MPANRFFRKTTLLRSTFIIASLFACQSANAATCADILTMKSRDSGQEITFKVTNNTTGARNYDWLSYEGKRENYGNIAPGETVRIKTFISHPWIFSDSENECVEAFLPTVSDKALVLTQRSKADPTVVEPAKGDFVATAEYERVAINGFTLLISPALAAKKKMLAKVTAEFTKQSKNIQEVLPADKFKMLQGVKIWFEYNAEADAGARYNISKQYLIENSINPDKFDSIEIVNAKNFVDWSKLNQPWVVLHELAHAYHNMRIDELDDTISQTYEAAKASKVYEKVKYGLGGRKRAYALNNRDEYFAELTEAYFGLNDFYPFNRADLEKHDPAGYNLMKFAWKNN